MAQITHDELTRLLGLPSSGDARAFRRVSAFTDARPDAVVFALGAEALARALASEAGLILASTGGGDHGERVLEVENPRYAFALVAQRLDELQTGLVHRTAVIEGQLGSGCSVGAGSVIMAGARIGADCAVGPLVTIYGCVTMGRHCTVQAGAVLGAMGFGYAQDSNGRSVRFPQIGTLSIGDDVEIGANTTIDRGALGETRIGRGTKIDNLVHIAHNCVVGEDVLIAAQVGLAGSCVIEDGAMLGGQVGLGEKVTIGRGVVLGGQGGVLPGKRIDGPGQVFWGTPARPVREYLRDLVRLRRG